MTAAARAIAEREGWRAVTIRRLADEIDYSQPVLYSHFASRDAIVAAVAIDGFRELASELRRAATDAADRQVRLRKAAAAYLAFARAQPALYQAMFTLRTALRFAEAESRPELRDAFAALSEAVAPTAIDLALATETFWAMLHGLADLERAGRIRPGAREERLALAVECLLER